MLRLSALLFLSITTNLSFIGSEPSLIILQNNNGVQEPISSVLKIKTGNNVSLTCKTMNTFSNEMASDLVAWSKELHLDQFNNEISNKIINVSEPSQLDFKPVKMIDRGTYYCKNTKYNLSKKLQVIVDYYKKTLDSRWKRAQYNYGHGYPWGVPTPKPDVHRSNLPMHVQDMVDNFQRSAHESNWDTYHNPNSQNPYWQQNPNRHWNEEQSVEIKNSYKPPVVASPKQSYAVFYFLGGGAAVLLLFGGLCVIAQNHNNGPRRVPVNAIPLPFHGFPAPPTTRARTEPVNDDAPTLYTSLIDPNNSAGTSRSNLQPRRHSVAAPLVPNAPMMSNADAPPSYDNLARNPNDPSTAPPTYDEAMTNIGVRLLNPGLTHIVQGLQNVVLSAPVVSSNDI